MSILPSARKHGVAEADIRHAFRHAMWTGHEQEGDMFVAVGVAHDGQHLLEIGYAVERDGAIVVFHAMAAREKYLRRMR